MFIITITTTEQFWLKGTVWTSSFDRADQFATEALAKASALKAEKFMTPKTRKAYRIEAL